MKRKNILITLGLVFSLLFVMAFACNSGDERGGGTTDGSGAKQPRSESTSPDGAPTENEIKAVLERNGSRTIEFDSAVQIAAKTKHAFNTGVTVNAYPVKVDYTQYDNGKPYVKYTGGIMYFYRDDFGSWTQASGDDGPRSEFVY